VAVTVSNLEYSDAGSLLRRTFDLTFDSSYPLGGESLSVSDLGLSDVKKATIDGKDGFRFSYDYVNDKVLVHDKPFANTVVTVTDNDSAASAGVAVYVHIDEKVHQGADSAHLEFVSPTNTDGTGTAYNGGPTYYIDDDDNAASGGLALYFDEDATLGSRFLANIGRDAYVSIGGGRAIKVTHNAAPGTPGVQVYFDEDAANSYGRLQFVSPTNAAGSETTSSEVNSATNLSALTTRVELLGV
jgi:hypothetical protein